MTIIVGLILLVRANRRFGELKKILLPFVFLLTMLALVLIDKTLIWVWLPSMFTAPEIVSFGMVGIFESCVRNRLIPYNENYGGFFAQMRFPALITDRELHAAHCSAEPVNASAQQLRSAPDKPVYIDADTKLTGRSIAGGCAFYTEDESELHRMNERLTEANELIAERMLPYHRRALAMLDEMQPDAPDFRERVARLNLLNAYIKRGTNLLLTGEGEELSLGEKMLFAGRSRSSLKSFGIVAAAVNASYSVGYQTAAYN